MNRLLLSWALAGGVALSAAAALPGQMRIGVDEEAGQAVIYAVGVQDGNRGVYTLPISGQYSATKLSGATYIQYTFGQSGGTFTDKSTVYGTKDVGYSVYAGKATAQGGGDGPWSHVMWAYRSASFVPYTYEVVATDMAYDPVGGKIYGWFKADASGSRYHLGVYDGDAVKVTPVGSDVTTVVTALASDADGNLWGVVGGTGALVGINKSTGAVEQKALTGIVATGANQSAAIDSATGRLLWSATDKSGAAVLYSVNLADGEATEVYSFPANQTFNAFFIPAATGSSAPAAATGLTATFNGTDVAVTFTAPVTTVSAGKLSGTLTYTLSLDGEPLASGEIEPGADFAANYAMADGMHTLAVVMANGAGTGPEATVEFLSGYDVPAPLSGVHTSVSGLDVAVSWEAATAANDGLLLTDELGYRVTRLPDSVVVAELTTATECTDVLPDLPATSYAYEVTTIYRGEEAGTVTSPRFIAGEAYTVPYTPDLDSATSLEQLAFTVIDLDPGTNTWRLDHSADGHGCISVTGANYNNHRDYLFTAPLQLSAGVKYHLDFGIAASNTFNSTQLSIFLAHQPTADSEQFITPYIEDNLSLTMEADQVNVFQPQSYTVEVARNGVYYIGFYDFADYYVMNTVSLDSLSLTAEPGSSLAETVADSAAAVRVAAGAIEISGTARVITPAGVEVGRVSGSGRVAVTPGIYLVVTPASTVKVAVGL